MIYTIQTSDDLIGREYLDKIYKKNDIQADLMNTMEFNCQDSEIEAIIDYCFTSPFFSDNKVALLKNPIFLTSENDRKDYTHFIDKLCEYIENENENTLLVIYANYEKLDERKKIVKFLKEKTNFKKLETPNPSQLAKIVQKMVEKNGCSMSMEDAMFIIEKVGHNLIDLRQEVDKLTLFKPDSLIERVDIEDFIVYDVDSSVFDLSNAILERNTAIALNLFEDLTKGGFEPIVLISVLANQLRIALLAKAYQRIGYDQASIAKKLKVHPFRVKLALKLTFSDKDIKDILVKLAMLDYQIKIGKVNKHHGLKIFILSI